MSRASNLAKPVKPERLRFGDAVGIVAPASPPPDPGAVDRSVAALERLGFKPKLAANVRKRLGFLAGTDRERAADLMRMFNNSEVRAIFCLRGGYGAARLWPLLDYQAIKRNPKILLGYSDITSLHCALLIKANLVSFHGPMLNSEIAGEDFPGFALKSLLRTLMEAEPTGSIRTGFKKKTVTVLRGGRARGALIGGNLSVLCTTLGTPLQPVFKNKILFIEDVGERPYRFDRLLTHLLSVGALQQVAGVAVGICVDCVDHRANTAKEYRHTLEDVLKDRLLPLKVPVVTGLPFGHQPWNATLPIGVRAELDAEAGDLIVTEPAVH